MALFAASSPLHFKTPATFRRWLAKNHDCSEGVWLRLFKKGSGEPSITQAEALDEALCFGWIDGQLKPLDKLSWLRKFTPRRPKSTWSKINTQHADRLVQLGVMTLAGLEAIAAAKADGRWAAAYASPKNAAPPEDFLEALAANPPAEAFFKSLNKANIYSIVYRLETAKKPETRAKRLKMILQMLATGQRFHP